MRRVKWPQYGRAESGHAGRQALARLSHTSARALEHGEHRETDLEWCGVCRRETQHVSVATQVQDVTIGWCCAHRGEAPAAVTI